MSSAPVVFKRTKSKAATRPRQSRLDTEKIEVATDNAAAEDPDDSPSAVAAKLKKDRKTRSKPKVTVSFGGDDDGEDGEVFKVKKSNLSQKLTLGRRPDSPGNVLPSSLDQATISPVATQGPTYDAAYLSELKASTPTSRPRTQATDSYDVDVSIDGNDIPSGAVELADLTADADTVIPSESSVLAAKQKRERLRVAPSDEDDFISLSLAVRDTVSKGPHPDSRLMREEDEVGEGDDEFAEYTSAQERIALGKKSRKAEASKKRNEMKEMIADADEEDEETVEWENEQLRRGGHVEEDPAPGKPAKAVYKPAPIPPVVPIPTLGPAIARLNKSMSTLTTSHAQSTTSLGGLAEERVQLDVREREIREMIVKAEAKRSWFAAFREWVESVATFLDEKFPLLEKLEEEQVSLLKERHDMVTKRRKQDDEDDLSLFLGTLPTPPVANADEFDELGRIIPRSNPSVLRRERRIARATRHDRRRGQIHTRRTSTITGPDDEEGFSTDGDLSPSDAADYDAALTSLSIKARDVLSDVRALDFKDPARGLGKWFGEWRARYSDVYTGAWGGLGMVGAWEFWVRLEIVGWNPIADAARTLDGFAWFAALYEYSRPRADQEGEEATGEDGTLGPDGDLVSAMISTAVLPRLCRLIESGAVDVYSGKDLRRLVDLAEQVEMAVERGSPRFQMLLKSAAGCFRSALEDVENTLAPYLALNAPRFDPEAIPARKRMLARHSKLLTNLVRWRKYTGEMYGVGEMITRLLGASVFPIAESGWEVGGQESMKHVVQLLPGELVPPSLRARML